MSEKYKQRNTAVAEYQCQKSINTFTLVTSQGWSVTNSRMQTLCFRKKTFSDKFIHMTVVIVTGLRNQVCYRHNSCLSRNSKMNTLVTIQQTVTTVTICLLWTL